MSERHEARKAEIEKENNALVEEFKKLNEQGAAINRRVSEIRGRQLQLQGAYDEVLKNIAAEKEEAEKDKDKPVIEEVT